MLQEVPWPHTPSNSTLAFYLADVLPRLCCFCITHHSFPLCISGFLHRHVRASIRQKYGIPVSECGV